MAGKKSFEQNMARLQEIVAALERENLPLDEGLALYREGMRCSRLCREHLEHVRHELTVWQDGEDRPLDPAALAAEDGRETSAD